MPISEQWLLDEKEKGAQGRGVSAGLLLFLYPSAVPKVYELHGPVRNEFPRGASGGRFKPGSRALQRAHGALQVRQPWPVKIEDL